VNVRVALGETAGVEAGTTGYFQKVGFRAGPGAGPKCIRDCCGVIAKDVLTTECVEPRTSLEQAFRVSPERAWVFRARKVGSRVLNSHRVSPVP
jgi:hypothetical protein